jgi:hypothetical protein
MACNWHVANPVIRSGSFFSTCACCRVFSMLLSSEQASGLAAGVSYVLELPAASHPGAQLVCGGRLQAWRRNQRRVPIILTPAEARLDGYLPGGVKSGTNDGKGEEEGRRAGVSLWRRRRVRARFKRRGLK